MIVLPPPLSPPLKWLLQTPATLHFHRHPCQGDVKENPSRCSLCPPPVGRSEPDCAFPVSFNNEGKRGNEDFLLEYLPGQNNNILQVMLCSVTTHYTLVL